MSFRAKSTKCLATFFNNFNNFGDRDLFFSFQTMNENILYNAARKIPSDWVRCDGVFIKVFNLIFLWVSNNLLEVVSAMLMTSKFSKQWRIARISPAIPK